MWIYEKIFLIWFNKKVSCIRVYVCVCGGGIIFFVIRGAFSSMYNSLSLMVNLWGVG